MIFTLIGIIVTTSCSNTSDLEDASKDGYHSPMSISIEEALKNADSFFSMIECKTRSNRRVKSVEKISGALSTRSGENATEGYYIVNYENDGGFAVLSADKRLGTIFAIGEEGSVSLADTIDNPTLGVFFNELNSTASAPILRDSLIAVPWVPHDSLSYMTVVEQLEPKIPRNIAKWPGNETYGVLGQYSALTISMAQIMATFRHPNRWNTDNLNWDIISSFQFPTSNISTYNPFYYEYVKNFLTTLEYTFGIEHYPGGCSFESISDQTDYIIHQHYTPPINTYVDHSDHGFNQPYSTLYDSTTSFLNDGDILLMGIGGNEFGTQYAWLTDGYIRFNKEIAIICDKSVDFMCHCVWGKGGKGNGYYVIFGDMLGKARRLDTGSTPIDIENLINVGMVGFNYKHNK